MKKHLLLLVAMMVLLSACGNDECLECRFKDDGEKSEWGENDDEDIRKYPTHRVIIDDGEDD